MLLGCSACDKNLLGWQNKDKRHKSGWLYCFECISGGSLNIKDFKRCNGALNTVEEIRAAWQQAFKSQMLLNKIENLDSRSG